MIQEVYNTVNIFKIFVLNYTHNWVQF